MSNTDDLNIKKETDDLAKTYIRFTILTTVGVMLCIIACVGLTVTQNLTWLMLFIPAVIYSIVISWFMFRARKRFYSHVQLIPVHYSSQQ